MKKRLLISFSGGKTSAYMLWWLFNVWKERADWEMVAVFANTGKEAEGTLRFVDDCANEWGIPVVWVESYPKPVGKGWGVVHKVVSFESASRNGEPFEAMISRLGIPSQHAPFCSDQLKRKAIESYLKSIGWTKYYKAIGIRFDELNRKNRKAFEKRIIYPLIDLNPSTKQDINNWWNKQTFNLEIHPDEGNCNNCWKKNIKVLCRNAVRNPRSFDWWQQMTDKYGHYNPRNLEVSDIGFNFYREGRSPVDIIALAKGDISQVIKISSEETSSGCQESCEAF